MDGSRVETASLEQLPNATLGQSLVAAREGRGLSRETVVQHTRIPARYVQMLEDDDYRRIPDRLYILPFLRRYASFLGLDTEEAAMRLVREVQRIDESPSTLEAAEPLDHVGTARRRDWTTSLLFSGFISVIVGAYIVQSRHNESEAITGPELRSVQPAVAPSPSSLTDIVNPALAAQAATPTDKELEPTTRAQRLSQTRTSANPSAVSVTEAIVVPAATVGESHKLPLKKSQRAHRLRTP